MSKPPPRPVTAYQIEKSLQQWQALQAAYDLDPSLETDEDAQGRFLHAAGVEPPHTLLAILIDDVIAMERKAAHADNLRKRYTSLRDRINTRADRARATVEQLLDTLDLKAWEGDEGTAAMRKRPPSVIITDLDKLPDEFKTTETVVTPNKIPIGAKLRAGEAVEGAELSNPTFGLTLLPY
jgi:hypothetical protein